MFLLSQEHTDPEIVSVCPDAIPLSMHPTTIVHVMIFAFMFPLNPKGQHGFKLFTRLLVRPD
jgi:hypothetical protein